MGRDHLGQFAIAGNQNFARGVLLIDDCDGTLDWGQITGQGTDDTVDFATSAAFVGTKGLRIKTGTTGPADGDNTTAYKYTPFPESGLIVTRFKWRSPDVSVCELNEIALDIYDGADIYTATFRHKPNEPKFYYVNSAGAEVEIAALNFATDDYVGHNFEMVIDALAMEYVAVMMQGIRVDLSGISLQDTGDSAQRHTRLRVTVEANGAAAAEMHCDNFYLGEFLDV